MTLTPYDRELLKLRPLAYWKLGTYRAEATDPKNVTDLSGRDQHLTGTASGSGAQTNARESMLPGDPYGAGQDVASHAWRRSGGISGFSSSSGCIIAWAQVRSALTGGLFDSNPAAVGAMRVFSEDNFATLRWDIGGSTLTANFSKAVSALPGGANAFFGRAHLFAVSWRSGIAPDTVFFYDAEVITPTSGFAARDKAPACANFDVGSYNSTRAPATIHSCAVFDKHVDARELAILYRAGMDRRLIVPGRI